MAKVRVKKQKSFFRQNWMLILAIVYVLSPLDFVPDALLPVGLGDDILVLLWALIKKYFDYRKDKNNIVEGEIIDE